MVSRVYLSVKWPMETKVLKEELSVSTSGQDG